MLGILPRLHAVAYLDGSSVHPDLAGVLFEIRPAPAGLACSNVHPDCTDHMVQYSPDEQARYFRHAAAIASEGDAHLFTADGHLI